MLNARGVAKLLALLLVLFSMTAGFVMRPANATVCSRCLLAGDVDGAGIIPDPTKLIFNGVFEGVETLDGVPRDVTYTTHLKADIVMTADGQRIVGEGVLEFRGDGRGVAWSIPVEIDSFSEGGAVHMTFSSEDDGEGEVLPPINVGVDEVYTVSDDEGARLVGTETTDSSSGAQKFDLAGPANFEN